MYSCFYESAEPSQYAARDLVVRSNVDLMFWILLIYGNSYVHEILIFAIASMLTLMEVGGTLLASRQPRFFAPPANVLGLSIEEKDRRPLNGREIPPSDGTSIHSPQQQAHQQDPRGCVVSKSPSQVLTELGNLGLSWQEGGYRM